MDQVSTETMEWLMSGGLLTPLLRECCERVLWEARTERAGELFDELLREILVECVDSVLLELAFHDMTSPLKPFIAKIDMNELIATAAAASPKTSAKKRPIDQNSSLLSPSPLESKKPKPNLELDTEMMNPVDEEDLARLQDDIERCMRLKFKILILIYYYLMIVEKTHFKSPKTSWQLISAATTSNKASHLRNSTI